MKPFNLEEYFKNPERKVVTRNGRKVRVVCTDKKGDYPIVALVEYYDGTYEIACLFKKDGRFQINEPCDEDLFFAPEKHEGWINVFEDTIGSSCVGSRIFKSKKDAEKEAKNYSVYKTTIKIEWEE